MTCASRATYLQIKEKKSLRLNNHQRISFSVPTPTQVPSQEPVLYGSMNNFPLLPTPRKRVITESQQPAVIRSQSLHSTRSLQKSSLPTCSPISPTTPTLVNTSPTQPSSSNNNNTTLFSMEELNSLCTEMITYLSVCKNKIEQFNVIAQLACKFLYSNGK